MREESSQCPVPGCKNVRQSKGKNRSRGRYCFDHDPSEAGIRRREKRSSRRKSYRVHLEETCSRCKFVPEWIGQLDIHHKDQNHENDDPDNLQTVCANCHRLIHKQLGFDQADVEL